LAGCDRLILRHDTITLPAPILTHEQVRNLSNKVDKSVGDVGYQGIGDCSNEAVSYCARFENHTHALVTVSVSRETPSKLEAGFSSFGNIIDKSEEVFNALRKAFQ
jgi:hypothetical protein